jgi:large subunit ribosomal protein L10
VQVNRSEKKLFVEKFSESCGSYPCMIVVRQVGLSASAVSLLRKSARAGGVVFQVVKNNLAKRAFEGDASGIRDCFKGPLGVFFSQDPVAASKIIDDFSKKREDSFYPIGGILNNKNLSREDIKRLATLPTLDQLRSQILGMLMAPATKLVGTINAPAQSLVRVMSAKNKKQEQGE